MNQDNAIDAQVNKMSVAMLAIWGPTSLAPLVGASRLGSMAQELEFAIRNTSGADMTKLLGHLAGDSGTAVHRRTMGLIDLVEGVALGIIREVRGLAKSYREDEDVDFYGYLGGRMGTGVKVVREATNNGKNSLISIGREIKTDPSEAGPKLLTLVLASVATSGGLDGNGGVPDLDIPLMGIGAHRSPFTHSILIGSMLEAALLLVMRIILCTHKNLPLHHDPLWDGFARRSVDILNAAGKGASIGIAYHLMVDAFIQPGAYHGLPFDMPMEGHQIILAGNSVAEGKAADKYPDEEVITATPEIIAEHKKYRIIPLLLAPQLRQLLSPSDISTLEKYGSWLLALETRKIPPTTIAQARFLKVANGLLSPTTAHEKAWMALLDARRRTSPR